MKKTGLNVYVYDFSVDYDVIAVDNILDIHKYLMKKNNMIWICLGLLKKFFFAALTILSTLSSINPLKCIFNEQSSMQSKTWNC